MSVTLIERKKKRTKLFILPLALISVFFISILDMPHGFYTFARIAITLFSAIFLFNAYATFKSELCFYIVCIPVSIIAILWNPIIPVYLDKETWVMLDIFAIISEIVVGIITYFNSKEDEE